MSQLKILCRRSIYCRPTTAYWLARAGASVTVIERKYSGPQQQFVSPDIRMQVFLNSGQAVRPSTCETPASQSCARCLAWKSATRSKRTTIEGISFVRDDGSPYGVLRASSDPDQQNLSSEYEIFRGDLSRILYDLTKDNKNIKYVFNLQVSSISQNEKDDAPVTVNFANGYSSSKYDLIVACDGSTSQTRAIGLGCGVRDYIKPINSWAAYFSIMKDLLGGSKIGQAHSTVGGRFVAIGPDPTPGVNHVALFGHPSPWRQGSNPSISRSREGRRQRPQRLSSTALQGLQLEDTGSSETHDGL